MGKNFNKNAYKGINYYTIKRLEEFPFLLHGFSGELDNKKGLFYEALGLVESDIFSIKQVHSNHILCLTDRECCSECLKHFEGDAMITDQTGFALAVRTADCLPIILVDPKKKVVAVIHAGRRGTFLKITKKVIDELKKTFDVSPDDLLAGMGPSIKECCYEVGHDVIELIKENFVDFERYIQKKGNKYLLDIALMNKVQLLEEGVLPDNITGVDLCTYCSDEAFHSYRKTREKTGRMLNIVMLKDDG
jgi:polyphenol oxidase